MFRPYETMPPEQRDGRQVILGWVDNPRSGAPFLATTATWDESAGVWDCDNRTAGKLADDMGIDPTHWAEVVATPLDADASEVGQWHWSHSPL